MNELRELFHTLNNQLGIILTHAELLEAKAPDEALRKKAATVLETTMEALSTARAIRARIDDAARLDPGPGTRDPESGQSHTSPHS